MCGTVLYNGEPVTYSRFGGQLGGPVLLQNFRPGVPVEAFWGPRPVELKKIRPLPDLRWTSTGWIKVEKIPGLMTPEGFLSPVLPAKPNWGTIGTLLDKEGERMEFVLLPGEFMEGGSFFDFTKQAAGMLGVRIINRMYVVTATASKQYQDRTRHDRMPVVVPRSMVAA